MLQSISLCHRRILYVRMSSVFVKLDCKSDSIQTHPEDKTSGISVRKSLD